MSVLDFLNTGLQAGAQILNQINQRKTWEREDTAVQRRVKDLKDAGLSPVLAAGSAASTSAPIRVEAPQIERRVGAQEANIGQTKAQTKLTEAQLKAAGLQYEINEAHLKAAGLQYDINDAASLEARNRAHVLRKDAEENGTLSWELANSQIAREIQENREVSRNIGIYKEFGLPTIGHAGDDILASTMMLKQLFPGMDPGKTGGASVVARTILSILGGLIK